MRTPGQESGQKSDGDRILETLEPFKKRDLVGVANWVRYGALAGGLGLLFFYSLYHVAVYYRAHRLAQDLRETVQKQEVQLAALEAENGALRTRSRFLAPDSLDLDYLELMARQQLRYARESEVIRVLRVDEMP